MRISDWSSDVCSSDLDRGISGRAHAARDRPHLPQAYRVPGCHPTVYSWQLEALYGECSRRLSFVASPRLSRYVLSCQVEHEGAGTQRQEERRVGKECALTCQSVSSQYH